MITTELGILINYVVSKEHLNICSIRIVNGLLHELFSFACVCLNDIMFFCVIWQIFSNVSGYRVFSLLKSRKCFCFFFSPQLLLSDWYYCVICVLAAKKVCSCEKSRLVENRLQSSLFYFVFELLHIVFSKLVLLISVTTLTSGIFTHTTTNVSLTLSMAAWVWMLPLTKNQFHHRCSLDVFGNLHASCFKNTPEHLLSLSARLPKSSHRRFFIKRFS